MRRKQLRVGIIGCGAIGTFLTNAIKDGKAGNSKVSAVYDISPNAMKKISEQTRAPIARNINSLISKSDLVVECASQNAVTEYAPKILKKRDLMVLSVGALLDEKLLSLLISIAEKHGKRIYIPSGAVSGIDALKGAGIGRIDSVSLTTTKPPASFGLDQNSDKRVLFTGTPEEAVVRFPTNINVSAAIRIASGKVPIQVEIVSDPSVKLNTHELTATGEFGSLTCKTENRPSKNPKTSALAAMSAVSMIKGMTRTLVVGT